MKPDPLTTGMTAENHDKTAGKARAKVDRIRVETNPGLVQAHSCGLVGTPLVWWMCRAVRQAGRPATTPLLNINVFRTLHDLFNQDTGPASRSGKHQVNRKVVVLQKRG